MAIFIISDAHLGSEDKAQEQIKSEKLFSFLDLVKQEGQKLYILGDLFDFWFEYKHAVPKQHLKVVLKLTSLIESGIPIHYITGNHDFWLGDFLADEVGVTVHRDFLETIEQNLQLFMIHGDGLAKADWKYRAFVRTPLRNCLAIWLYRLIPPDWGIPLAKAVSSRSRKHTSGRQPRFLKDYQEYARNKLKEGYDAVLIGHTHQPEFIESENGIYLNTGDFYEHFSYGKLEHGSLTLNYFK